MSSQDKNNRPTPMGGGFTKIEKANDIKGTLRKIWLSFKPYKASILVILLFAIGSTVFAIIGPKLLGDATTELFTGIISKIKGGSGINFDKIHGILTLLFGLYFISTILGYLQGLITTKIAQKYTYELRDSINQKIKRLPMSYFDSKNHGETLSIITNDIDMINQSISQSAVQIVSSVTTVIGIIIMMLSIDWLMTIISLAILPLSIFMIGVIMKRSQRHFTDNQVYLGHVNGSVEEMFSGHNVVKSFNAEGKVLKQFNYNNNKLYNAAWKSQFLSGLMQPIMMFMGNIGYVIVSIFGGWFVIIGRISVGNILSFIQYSRNATQNLGQLAAVSSSIQGMIAASERIFSFLELEEETQVKTVKINHQKIKGEVKFKDVNFGYHVDQPIIKNLNLDVLPGQKIAIVGPTGAGKTTIVKLLMQFYPLHKGSILIDDHDIKEYNHESLSNILGMVLQDTWLFSGTILDNIKYGNANASMDEVINAAKAARIHHVIMTLPDGYNTILDEETSNLSLGEKQLITIARAILADPKVLILDEATSSVDTRTEILIQQSMDTLMKNRTSFIIAHRLSTIKNADLILVLDKGNIIEKGSHQDLIKAKGFYYNLYNSQFDHISN